MTRKIINVALNGVTGRMDIGSIWCGPCSASASRAACGSATARPCIPTVPLSRATFEPPTYHYKVGVAFLAWLNGLQPHFAMLGSLQRQPLVRHLIRVFELAAAARALADPELAVERRLDEGLDQGLTRA